jgi:putative transcriptional regulator
LSEKETTEYVYLDVPPVAGMRPCVGLVLAGMVTRARIGVGGLEEAVEVLESLHSGEETTRYRFSMGDDGVVAEVEDPALEGPEGAGWRTVVELVA